MNYKKIIINTAQPEKPKSRVMIIYTGGTFGMTKNNLGILMPFDFSHILDQLPTLKNLSLELTVISFDHPVDSSNIDAEHWVMIGNIISEHHNEQDGFVVLHGTDTMAYTASALSFMLIGLQKPVVFTGAQLPIGEPRSDARENLITALEIAASKIDDRAVVPEVCLYFDYVLLRGCRSKKVESMHFDAFESGNYPHLAKAGVTIDFNFSAILAPNKKTEFKLLTKFDNRVAILKLFPGISEAIVKSVLHTPELKGVIIETFGSGNAPTSAWLIELLKEAIQKGIIVLNISQCTWGMVIQGKYETSRELKEIGMIGGADMTTEAAIVKMMLLLGEFGSEKAKQMITNSLAGEIS